MSFGVDGALRDWLHILARRREASFSALVGAMFNSCFVDPKFVSGKSSVASAAILLQEQATESHDFASSKNITRRGSVSIARAR